MPRPPNLAAYPGSKGGFSFWHVCRDVRYRGKYSRVSGPAGGLSEVPLHVWHDERANRAVIAAVSKTHTAVEVLTRLHLLLLEQVTGGDIEPAGDGFH